MAYKPGTRCWAAAFLLSRPPSRILHNLQPTYVEFTCGGDTWEQENKMREKNYPATRVAPVMQDDKANLTMDIPFEKLRFFSDKASAERSYRAQIVYEQTVITEAMDKLEALKANVDALITASITSDTDSTGSHI